jgi:hypothetical protein
VRENTFPEEQKEEIAGNVSERVTSQLQIYDAQEGLKLVKLVMEIPTQPSEPLDFSRSEKFEINDIKFREIKIDHSRISAVGKKSWTKFELLLSFIGAAWMEKWRRFGAKVLVIGILLLAWPIAIFLPSMWYMGTSGMFYMIIFMIPGIILVILWAILKREALLIFTPGGIFKIEGSVGFVDAVWSRITELQRQRDV